MEDQVLSRKVSPFKLGLFILICGAIGVAAVIWLGTSHLFENTRTYVSYFDESVRGLQKDATINYRGVAVGRVASVELASDGKLIQVTMKLQSDFNVTDALAIQLRDQGLTGMRYLEIDTAPGDLARMTPQIAFTPKHPVIRSYPSEIVKLKYALQSIYDKLNDLDLKSLTENWTKTAALVNTFVAHINEAIDPEEWKATVTAMKQTVQGTAEFTTRLARATTDKGMRKGFTDLASTLEASRQASEALSKQIGTLPPGSLSNMVDRWDSAIKTGQSAFSSIETQLGESNTLFQQNLQQLKLLLTQLNSLMQSIKEKPNQLLLSPGEPDPFERKRQ